MSVGYSKPWSQVIKILTGGKSSEIDPQPLIEYFKPLSHWLINENRAERIGWSRLNEDIGKIKITTKLKIFRNTILQSISDLFTNYYRNIFEKKL